MERAGAAAARELGLGSLRRKVMGDRRAWRLLLEVIAGARGEDERRALATRFARRRALVAERIGGPDAEAKALVLDALMLGLAAERLAGASDAEVERALDAFEALAR
ncbi:MAG TPA: hypothetical protein VFM93_10330 [Candidatus Limnocylindria bacterium]|nr:hypothetical protein [Candidatus Limnocylindria bacterium]